MRKMVLLASMMALAALMLAAAPASAQEFDGFCEEFDGFVICDEDEFCEDFDGDFFCDEDEFCEDFDGDFFCDEDDFFGDGGEQEAESGDVDQSFTVTGDGDNSNQTVGIQGVANTGNVQNTFGFNDGFGDGDFVCDEVDDGFCDDFFFDGNGDVEFEDGGASIELSPTQVVTSDQQVNQAAAASAFWPWWK